MFQSGAETFVGLVEALLSVGMLAPGGPPGAAALLMAVEDLADDVGEVFAGGVFGFDVHGAGAVVVGQDHLMTALIENPRLCSPKFLTCEQRSV
ncbi:hypothetical protein [Mycolicibacterium grossiae]|uniref:hypothetical protein n=1 Tax=Mycolicibacterium grossiae TaxID=1552759 RepID=UPI0011F1D8E1|nr:hypothetical protein [Mycolicibacterium grossiae]QEM48602.1 hypothetical protein FZ046_27050 [Mycolicibacterium grossiae]QEM48612.1 hypothetical protein FZ046_27160 [Mycolicibacterium grossiae]